MVYSAALLLTFAWRVGADNNFLTGANDVIAVQGEEGEILASPFSVQFGKKDIWLPRWGWLLSPRPGGSQPILVSSPRINSIPNCFIQD